MVRYELFVLGRTWNDEYGTAEDPTELGWLLGYSPYHAVREGTAYPAVLFTTFESDTRVDPLHARKLAAALQAATTAEAPVVLRREWRGTLVREPRGSNGFGYDPIFVPDGETRTSAELAPEEKDAASHRGQALRALVPYLRELGQK